MTVPRRLLVAFVAWMVAAPDARLAAQARSATLVADFSTFAKLTLSTATVSFPDADPDTIPLIPSSGGPLFISAKARATPGAQVVLTVVATDDLRSGVNLIPASNITWTATGPGFAGGTLSTTSPATVGTWSGSGVRTGTQQLYFTNLWSHPTGIYTVSLLYTLTSP
jgi:hypothetical protein